MSAARSYTASREVLIVVSLTLIFAAAGLVGWVSQTKISVTESVLVRMDVPALARDADFVTRSRAIAQRSIRVGDEIFTETTLRVIEAYRGIAPAEFKLRTRGGSVPGLIAFDDDDADIPAGGEVVLFVVQTKQGHLVALGGFQGRYHISGAQARNESRVTTVAELRRQVVEATP